MKGGNDPARVNGNASTRAMIPGQGCRVDAGTLRPAGSIAGNITQSIGAKHVQGDAWRPASYPALNQVVLASRSTSSSRARKSSTVSA